MANSGPASERADHDGGAAPTLAAAARRPVLYLLSSDDGLLVELGPLLGDRYRTRPIDSAEQLEPPANSPWAMLIDATTRADARAQAARLEQQHPLAPLVIICADGAAADWSAARSRGMVSAVIERSATQSAALGDALDVIDRQMASGLSGAAAESGHAARNTARRAPVLWLLLALALVAVAAAAWYLFGGAHRMHSRPPAPQAPLAAAPATIPALDTAASSGSARASGTAVAGAAPAVAGTAAKPRSVLELLSDARVAFSEGRNLLPRTDEPQRGDSAYELYMNVLAQDPQNEEAREGLRRLLAVAGSRVKADLAAGRLDEAGRLLTLFRRSGVDTGTVAALESEVAAARPRWIASQVRAAIAGGDTATASQLLSQLNSGGGDRAVLAQLRQELDAANARASLTGLAERAHAAIAAGALLDPESGSAQSRVQAMQQLDRNNPLTLSAQRELQAALLARRAQRRARRAIRPGAEAAGHCRGFRWRQRTGGCPQAAA